MATQTIDATLFASSHPDIAKRTSVSGLIISVGMMLVGILIFASIFEMSDKSSTLSMGLMVLGTALILLGGSVCSGNQKKSFICRREVWRRNAVCFSI